MNPRRFQTLALFLSLVMGVVLGLMDVPWIFRGADIMSTLFIHLLKLLSLPLIFFSILSHISGFDTAGQAKILTLKLMKYAFLTTFLAALMAGLFFSLTKTFTSPGTTAVNPIPSDSLGVSSMTVKKAVGMFVPENVVEAFLHNNVVGIVLMAFALALGVLTLPSHQKNALHTLFSGFFKATLACVAKLMWIMPLVVMSFVIMIFKESQGFEKIVPMMGYFLALVGANLFQACVVLPLFLKAKGIPVMKTVGAVMPALHMAFFSKSSAATLPTTMHCVQHHLGVSKKTSGFALPLASTVNMNGCAAFIFLTLLFVTRSYGMDYGFMGVVGIFVLSLLGAFGNAAVPMGCYFVTSAFLALMDVPLTVMGMILPLYGLIDMVETAVNVWSDVCITMAVNEDMVKESSFMQDSSKSSEKA